MHTPRLNAPPRIALSPGRKAPRRAWKVALVAGPLLGLALVTLAWELRENFHTVLPGRVFRSGQPGPESLRGSIARYHLSAVINLRGSNPAEAWYQDECRVAARAGVRHYDVPLDSASPPAAPELGQLIDLLETCPKPVLIHCESGIDRTGLVAAVCVLLLDDAGSPARARAQFSPYYGHLFWRANTIRQLAFVDQYDAWLRRNGYTHSRERFRRWCREVYDRAPAPASPPTPAGA